MCDCEGLGLHLAGEALERRKSEDKAETSVGLFEMVHRSESDSMASGLEQPCPPPLTQDEWFTFLDSSGPHNPAHNGAASSLLCWA